MQHQGAVRDRTRRERERLQLRMLVGTNLRRLSELNVVSCAVYKQYVLNKVSEQIVKCKDRIAQEYLMECLIMVFSDEYHLRTLDIFLSVVNKLQSAVNINSILIKLMERLSKFAAESENKQLFGERDIFAIFQNYCRDIIDKHKKMTLDDILALYVELVNFAAQCYPGKDEYIGTMMDETLRVIEKHCGDSGKVPSSAVSHIHRMMVAPIRAMNLRVLELKSYCLLMATLPTVDDVRTISCDIIEVLTGIAVDGKIRIATPEEVEKLFNMMSPLLYDEETANTKGRGDGDDDDEDEKVEDEGFVAEQNLVAALIHLIGNEESTDSHYKSLHLARKYLGKGGERRLLYTFPPMVFNALRLIQVAHGRLQGGAAEEVEMSVRPKKMFQFVHQICTAYGGHAPESGLRLWLQGAVGADGCGFSDICYEFLSQSFLCFEEHVSDSTEQYEAIRCIIGSLQRIECLDEENFDTLRAKCVSHSNRLLKKHCAARCFILCTNLYCGSQFSDGRVACKCLVKACKRATQMMEGVGMVTVFVQVLNQYVYLLVATQCADDVDAEKVSQLIGLVRDKIKEQQSAITLHADGDGGSANDDLNKLAELKQYFRLTLQYIEDLQNSDDDQIAQRFAKIEL